MAEVRASFRRKVSRGTVRARHAHRHAGCPEGSPEGSEGLPTSTVCSATTAATPERRPIAGARAEEQHCPAREDRYFSSLLAKSIFTCFWTIQSSPIRNSSPCPSTSSASTVILCWYLVVPVNLHTPSTLTCPPPKPSTTFTGASRVTQHPYLRNSTPATLNWAQLSRRTSCVWFRVNANSAVGKQLVLLAPAARNCVTRCVLPSASVANLTSP
jgi:hypothetical protein